MGHGNNHPVPDPDIGLAARISNAVSGVFPFVMAAAIVTVISSDLRADGTVSHLVSTIFGAVVTALLLYVTCLHNLSGSRIRGLALLREGRKDTLSMFVAAYMLLVVVFELLNALDAAIYGSGAPDLTMHMLLTGLAYLMILARYGTVLPAMVAGSDTSLATAASRSAFLPVFWRLLAVMAFPTLALTLAGLILVLGGIAGSEALPLGSGMLAELFMALVMNGMTVATSVVLCNAYDGHYR